MTYKDFPQMNIGASDKSELILCGYDAVTERELLSFLYFGEDGYYNAYIVEHDESNFVKIPDAYKLISSYIFKLSIYDDTDRTAEFYGKKINIYRAGRWGCIIEIII